MTQIIRGAAVLLLALCSCGRDAASNATTAVAGPEAPSNTEAPAAASPQDGVTEREANLPDATDLLERSVAAMGGREAIGRIATLHYRGQLSVTAQAIHGTMELWWKGGDFFTAQEIPGIGVIQAGKQGDVSWSEDPITGLRRLEGVEDAQHRWVSSLVPVAEWSQHFAQATTTGERMIDGRPAYDIALRGHSPQVPAGSKGAFDATMTIDAESYLLVAQSFDQATPMGPVPFNVKLEDYRTVEGVQFPFRQVSDLNIAQAVQTIDSLEINAEVDTSRFAMPHGDEDVVRGPDMAP